MKDEDKAKKQPVSELEKLKTKLKQAEKKIQELETEFFAIVEGGNDGIVIIRDLKIVFANRKVADMTGYNIEIADKVEIKRVVDSKYLQMVLSRYSRRMEGQPVTSTYSVELIHRDGHKIPVEISSAMIEYQGGPAGLIFIRDISGRKQALDELDVVKKRHQALFESSTDAIAQCDIDTRFLAVNPVMAKSLGVTANELVGVKLSDIVPAEVAEYRLKMVRKAIEDNQTQIFDDEREGRYFHIVLIPLKSMEQEGTVQVIVHDITEQKLAEKTLAQSLSRFKNIMEGTIHVVSSITEIRDPHTAGHQRRVSLLAYAIAGEMGLSEQQKMGIRMAGNIHDVGKINVPAEILSKPGRLTDTEFTLIKTHPGVGYDILKTIEFPWPVAMVVLQHHERLDGSGYPGRLSGKDILQEAKVIAVADVVEAMASHRPYRPALGIDKALEEVSKNKGVLYDPGAVDACLKLFSEGRFKFD